MFSLKKENIFPLKRLFLDEGNFGFFTYGLLDPQKLN
jgi:hypothetical protein